MAVKIYKPTTPGQRNKSGYAFEEITKSKPERRLTVMRKQNAGRNTLGRITVRHRGGARADRSVWLISNAIRSIFPPRLPRSNTIPTVRLVWLYCTMPMARSVISSLRSASKLAIP